MVRESKALFRVNVATKDAFPDNSTSSATAINVYRGVARASGTKQDLTRVRMDIPFREDVTKVVSARHVRLFACGPDLMIVGS